MMSPVGIMRSFWRESRFFLLWRDVKQMLSMNLYQNQRKKGSTYTYSKPFRFFLITAFCCQQQNFIINIFKH